MVKHPLILMQVYSSPMLDKVVIRVPTCACAGVGGDLEYGITVGGLDLIHCRSSAIFADTSRPVNSMDWMKMGSLER